MPSVVSPRVAATRDAVLSAAIDEFAAFGPRRASMEGIARRAGVSRATLYAHWRNRDELFRDLVAALHAEHEAEMATVLEDDAPFETRLLAMLEARFLRFVELTSASPHAAELYDSHGRLCGDIARASQERSEQLILKLLRQAVRTGEADLSGSGLSAAKVAGVLFDCAHGAKGEDASLARPDEFRARLRNAVAVLVAGLGAR